MESLAIFCRLEINLLSDNARVLSDIAYHCEAYWGYDPEYMENFRSLYRVTEEFIRHNRTYVLEDQNRILGFYGLAAGEPVNSLEYFFIEQGLLNFRKHYVKNS